MGMSDVIDHGARHVGDVHREMTRAELIVGRTPGNGAL